MYSAVSASRIPRVLHQHTSVVLWCQVVITNILREHSGSSALKMEAVCSSKMLVNIYQTTQHDIPKDSKLHFFLWSSGLWHCVVMLVVTNISEKTYCIHVRFEVFTAVVIWRCGTQRTTRHHIPEKMISSYCFHLQDRNSALKMKTVCFFEMLVNTCQSTWYYSPEDNNMNFHRCKDLKNSIEVTV
jgi:hypothetical protein